MKTILYILISTVGMYFALHTSYERDYITATVYDGCYEQYIANDIQAEDFVTFMTNCME